MAGKLNVAWGQIKGHQGVMRYNFSVLPAIVVDVFFDVVDVSDDEFKRTTLEEFGKLLSLTSEKKK